MTKYSSKELREMLHEAEMREQAFEKLMRAKRFNKKWVAREDIYDPSDVYSMINSETPDYVNSAGLQEIIAKADIKPAIRKGTVLWASDAEDDRDVFCIKRGDEIIATFWHSIGGFLDEC